MLACARTRVTPKHITLSGGSQVSKALYCMFASVWSVRNRQVQRDRRQTSGCRGVEGGETRWGMAANRDRVSFEGNEMLRNWILVVAG